MFHDRRLQYTEHQQLEGWKWNRPGDRLLDLGAGSCPKTPERGRRAAGGVRRRVGPTRSGADRVWVLVGPVCLSVVRNEVGEFEAVYLILDRHMRHMLDKME